MLFISTYDRFCQFEAVILHRQTKLTTKTITIMQLEFNFNQKDLRTNVAELTNNIYSILIWMQILANPSKI